MDDQICRGSVFYAPGSVTSNWINADKVAPSFLLYRRVDPPPSAGAKPPHLCRVSHCRHRVKDLQKIQKFRRERAINEQHAKNRSMQLQRQLDPGSVPEPRRTPPGRGLGRSRDHPQSHPLRMQDDPRRGGHGGR